MSTLELKIKSGPSVERLSGVQVGADVFELMTRALYVDPLSVYREYIQNSADGIEDAVSQGLLSSADEGRIDVTVDRADRSIKIRDNGCGVEPAEFESTLSSIGASKKKGTDLRGFRGIGRLSGLAFARELIFRSRRYAKDPVREMKWDGVRLRELLTGPDQALDIEDLVSGSVAVSSLEKGDFPEHFFEVELKGVVRVGNDDLLNEETVFKSISETAPVPFSESFSYKKAVEDFLETWGVRKEFSIFLNGADTPITRPVEDTFSLGKELQDDVSGVEFFEVPGDEGTDAIGWMIQHSHLGSIPKTEPVGGVRARVGNIQIGDRDIFSGLFPQKRFNAWAIAEIHILNDQIRPNSRRDAFESNYENQNLESHVVLLARKIATTCRKKSDVRNAVKRCEKLLESCGSVLIAFERGLFSADQARQKFDLNLSMADRCLARLEGDLQKRFEQQRNRVRKEGDKVLSHDQPASAYSSLPKNQQESARALSEIIVEESPSPEFAAKLIAKLIERLS